MPALYSAAGALGLHNGIAASLRTGLWLKSLRQYSRSRDLYIITLLNLVPGRYLFIISTALFFS